MKKVLLLFLSLSVTSIAFGQQQKGNSEVQISGFATVMDGNGFGSVFVKYGKFITDKVQVGVSPSVDFRTGNFSNTTVGAGAFLTYSFLTSDAQTVPYFGASYRKSDIDNWDFDYGSAGGQIGFKRFFTPQAAFDISGNYLVTIPADNRFKSVGLIYLTFGFSYLF